MILEPTQPEMICRQSYLLSPLSKLISERLFLKITPVGDAAKSLAKEGQL